jgi:hypothetical protein
MSIFLLFQSRKSKLKTSAALKASVSCSPGLFVAPGPLKIILSCVAPMLSKLGHPWYMASNEWMTVNNELEERG